MTQTFGNFERVIIQRISKAFELIATASGLLVIFPYISEKTRENVIVKTLKFEIQISRTPNGFKATITENVIWKRVYWRKWRSANKIPLTLQAANLLRLAKMIRTEIDSLGWDRGRRKTCDFCNGSGYTGFNTIAKKPNTCIKCGGNGIFVYPPKGARLCPGIFKDEPCPMEAAAEPDLTFCWKCFDVGIELSQEMEVAPYEFNEHLNGV